MYTSNLYIKQFMFFFFGLFIIFIYLTSYSNMHRCYMGKIYKIYNIIQFVYTKPHLNILPSYPVYVIFIHAVYCVDPHISQPIVYQKDTFYAKCFPLIGSKSLTISYMYTEQ